MPTDIRVSVVCFCIWY